MRSIIIFAVAVSFIGGSTATHAESKADSSQKLVAHVFPVVAAVAGISDTLNQLGRCEADVQQVDPRFKILQSSTTNPYHALGIKLVTRCIDKSSSKH